jgi:hypothetical protein
MERRVRENKSVPLFCYIRSQSLRTDLRLLFRAFKLMLGRKSTRWVIFAEQRESKDLTSGSLRSVLTSNMLDSNSARLCRAIGNAMKGILAAGNQNETFEDCFRRIIRLTDERLAHILEHWEMQGMEDELERVLQQPVVVRRSHSDKTVWLFYRFYTQTPVGGKWLCVLVKLVEDDAFVVTAYLTDKLKAGEDLWLTH